MEFFILDGSTYKPGPTIKNYETLVWTERYLDAGDFKLDVENEVSILTKLPPGSLVSHTDTKEVMIVENHEIGRSADKKLTVTVSGRTFETFAENRPTVGSNLPLKSYTDDPIDPLIKVPGDDIVTTVGPMPSPDLVQMLLRAGLEPGYATANDAIPNLIVTQSVVHPDAAMSQAIPRSDLYPKILEYLKLFKGGIKTIRPTGVATALDIRIHDGLDKQTTVVFYALYEDLEDTNYLWSIKDYKNYAQIATEIDARLYRDRNIGVELTGLERRVIYVEASDIKDLHAPPAAGDVVSARGQTSLDAKNKIALVNAKISNTATPKFKVHYDIGDIVTVFTEFAASQPMRVTEHILTVDKNGAIGYPSLSVV